MDLSLDDSQRVLADTFAEMLEKECPTSEVRACERGSGFSERVWERYVSLGAHVMGLPEPAGGLDMSLLELGLVATASGCALAPVPFLEVATVGRLLARVAPEDALLGAIVEGRPAASLVIPRPHAVRGTTRAPRGGVLVPFGATVESVVALEGETLFVARSDPERGTARLRDLGSGGFARWQPAPTSGRVLARGPGAKRAMAEAVAEWKLLAAFWLTGIGRRAIEIGAAYARERVQFGVPIGSFQAIAHPLADCATRVDGAELLCQEAAWAHAEEPARFELLSAMAFAWASESALLSTGASLHTHGGYGFSTEYDIQLFYRRARSLSSVAGGAREELSAVAERWGASVGAA